MDERTVNELLKQIKFLREQNTKLKTDKTISLSDLVSIENLDTDETKIDSDIQKAVDLLLKYAKNIGFTWGMKYYDFQISGNTWWFHEV